MKRVKDEATQLENQYNYERSVRLTGLADVDYKILEALDIKALNRFCTTSKYATKLCNNQEFWINKIQNSNLPLRLIDVYPTNYSDWLNAYGHLEDASFVAKNILLISNMDEIINILLDMRVAEKVLGIKIPTNVLKLLVIYDVEKKEPYVAIYEQEEEYVNKYNGDFNEVLLKAVYYTLIGYNNIIIDNDGIDYYINPNNYQNYINNLIADNENGREIVDNALIRVGMWKLIYYNENRK